MKFSGTVTLQYDTPFSPFKVTEYESALDWLKESGFDGAEVCISNYNGIDVHIPEFIGRRKSSLHT